MTEEQVLRLDGRVLATEDGKPLPITDIELVERKDKPSGGTRPVLLLSGMARAYLVSPQRPDLGTELLEEPLPFSLEYDALGRDVTIGLKQTSQALGLAGDGELVHDSGEWVMRFFDDHPKEVVTALRDRGLYVGVKAKPNWQAAVKFNDSPFYFNPFVVPKREPVSKKKLAEFRDRLRAKNGDDGGGGGEVGEDVKKLLLA